MRRSLYSLCSLAVIVSLSAGCAQLQENINTAVETRQSNGDGAEASAPTAQSPAPARNESASNPTEAAAEVTSPVKITIDGHEATPVDQFGIVWKIERRVSAQAPFEFTIDSELGDFNSLIINLYKADEYGNEIGRPWAITDFGGEKVLLPGRRISLSQPGPVTILTPENSATERINFESGQQYVALFVVSGSKAAHTQKVRFTVR